MNSFFYVEEIVKVTLNVLSCRIETIGVIHFNSWICWPYKVNIHFVCHEKQKWLVFFILTFEPVDEALQSEYSFCLSWRAEIIVVIHSPY